MKGLVAPSISRLSAVLVALVLAGAAGAPAAQAYERSLRPSAVDGRTLVLELTSLKRRGPDVRRARLSISRSARSSARMRAPVRVARIRAMAGRGRIRVLAPRRSPRAARSQARLVLTMSKAGAGATGSTTQLSN